jgi:hypothetical protein
LVKEGSSAIAFFTMILSKEESVRPKHCTLKRNSARGKIMKYE